MMLPWALNQDQRHIPDQYHHPTAKMREEYERGTERRRYMQGTYETKLLKDKMGRKMGQGIMGTGDSTVSKDCI